MQYIWALMYRLVPCGQALKRHKDLQVLCKSPCRCCSPPLTAEQNVLLPIQHTYCTQCSPDAATSVLLHAKHVVHILWHRVRRWLRYRKTIHTANLQQASVPGMSCLLQNILKPATRLPLVQSEHLEIAPG